MSTPRSRAGVVLSALLTLLLVLTGCAQIPTSGPVGTAEPVGGSDAQPNYVFSPSGPAPGDSPEEIVRGFITAGTGVQDDYATAREFLTSEAAASWQPAARTLIYASQPSVVRAGDDSAYSVQLEVDSVVDNRGIMTQMPENSTEDIGLTLTEVDGQWRIDQVPDGTVLESAQFRAIFAAQALYFYDQTFSYAVPDVRWFVNRPGTTSAMVSALLDGPAPYHAGAVLSAFPPGAELSRQSVPVSSGTAKVDLSATSVEGTDTATRRRMLEQITLTLDGLSTVNDVDLTVDQSELDVGESSPDFSSATVDPGSGSTQVAVADGELVYFEGTSVLPIGGVPSVGALQPISPAMNLDGTQFAFLNQDRTELYEATTDQQLRLMTRGTGLTRPSIDPEGWVWTVDQSGTSQVVALRAGSGGNDRRELSAEWLGDRQVNALRISRDGTRAAVVTGDAESASVFVAGVVRDSAGVPRGLGTPIGLQPTVPVTDVDWSSEQELLVAAPDDSEPVEAQILGLDGSQVTLKPLLGMTGFSAAPGENAIYAETADAVWMRLGTNWRAQSGQAQDLSYPG